MRLAQDKPLVYLISDGSITDESYPAKSEKLLRLVKVAVEVRIPLIQVREKNLSTRHLYDLTLAIVAISKHSQTRILVNDRTDVALCAGADGVHLTARSIAAEIVRPFVPNDFLIAVSTHSIGDLEQAVTGRADLAVFAPVFPTPGKGAATGLKGLDLAARLVSGLPVLALGGVDASNFQDVLKTQAAGFAAIRFLHNTRNLEKLSLELGL